MSVTTNQLKQFRNEVYQNFNKCKRTDTLMDLLDALSSNTTARTAVELTLKPHFRRPYSGLNKAMQVNSISNKHLSRLMAKMMDVPSERPFHLLGTDVTSEHDPYYNKDYFIADINPGEIFGISALIEPHIFTAAMRTDKVSRIIQINAPTLRALREVDLKLLVGLNRAVAKAAMERLQHTRVQLVAAKA